MWYATYQLNSQVKLIISWLRLSIFWFIVLVSEIGFLVLYLTTSSTSLSSPVVYLCRPDYQIQTSSLVGIHFSKSNVHLYFSYGNFVIQTTFDSYVAFTDHWLQWDIHSRTLIPSPPRESLIHRFLRRQRYWDKQGRSFKVARCLSHTWRIVIQTQ